MDDPQGCRRDYTVSARDPFTQVKTDPEFEIAAQDAPDSPLSAFLSISLGDLIGIADGGVADDPVRWRLVTLSDGDFVRFPYQAPAKRGTDNGERKGADGGKGDGRSTKDVIEALRDRIGVRTETVLTALVDLPARAVMAHDSHEKAALPSPFTVTLQVAPPVSPDLDFAIDEVNGTADQLPGMPDNPTERIDGRGVIIGVLDFGCDFAHPNFRSPGGDTRILWLWDQNAGPPPPVPPGPNPPEIDEGRLFGTAAINTALRFDDPYWALGYDPEANYYLPDGPPDGAHGTHVLDIAAGNGRASGAPGVAPAADIVFVQIKKPSPEPDGKHLIDSGDVVDGAVFVLECAERTADAAGVERPSSINISLNTNSGPHDGSTPFDQAIDNLLGKPGRAVVFAAGNARRAKLHTSGTVTPSAPRLIHWDFFVEDKTRNDLEIWYEGGGAPGLKVEIEAPDGTILHADEPDKVYEIRFRGLVIGTVVNARQRYGLWQILFVLHPRAIEERWGIRLIATDADAHPFDAWVERDDLGQSRLSDDDAVELETLGSFACGRKSMAVGAYDALFADGPVAPFSSLGPTRDNRPRPDVAAPGVNVRSARSFGGRTIKAGEPWKYPLRTAVSGTSMAAPHVAGAIALLYQEDASRDIEEARRILIETARGTKVDCVRRWDPGEGWGRIDIAAAVAWARCHKQDGR